MSKIWSDALDLFSAFITVALAMAMLAGVVCLVIFGGVAIQNAARKWRPRP